MAASFTSAQFSVFGNMRVFTGVVHMNDGAETISGLFSAVFGGVITPASAATNGMTKALVINSSSTVGAFRINSCTSGDAFNVLIMGA